MISLIFDNEHEYKNLSMKFSLVNLFISYVWFNV